MPKRVYELFIEDRWPPSFAVSSGITREHHYTYRVGEQSMAMTFSDGGEYSDEAQIAVETASLSNADLDANLAGMISLTVGDKPETLDITQIVSRLSRRSGVKGEVYAFAHPSLRSAILGKLNQLTVGVATHEAFPKAEVGSGDYVIICNGVPGVVARTVEAVGAFILPQRFALLQVTAEGQSAWDRLLKDDLLN